MVLNTLDNAQLKGASKEERHQGTPGLSKSQLALVVFLILAFTTSAYASVLFNFFAGDDFVHLTWLSQAVKHPELIWRNFHSSWLDGTTTKFYRPLISVFMVSDYLVWGLNGLGFHLTNLIFHLISTASLFFVSLRLSKYFSSNGNPAFAIFTALIFGLYPLHPESVSWITGRVDAIVTAFFLCSLLSYMQWRDKVRSRWWLAASMISMALGLLSKEMAIVLPATFLSYELFLCSRDRVSPGLFWRAAKPTLPFWALLAVYFGIRRMALGTFVGGYDDSLFFISNLRDFAYGWLHALKMLLIPINKELLSARSLLTRCWEISLVFIAFSFLLNIAKNRQVFWVATFISSWLFFSLAPVYKIFAIADDLQGSRLACLATVPLCVLFALAFTQLSRANGHNSVSGGRSFLSLDGLRTFWGVAFCVLAGIVLWTNNQAWADAGRESNAIRQSLASLYSRIPDDPQVLFVGLPDQRKGAYICRNALWGMTKSPQLSRDISNSIMVDKFEPILPFGFFKDSLFASKDKVKVFRWETENKNFSAIELSAATSNARQWKGEELKKLISVDDKEGFASFGFTSDGNFSISTDTRRARRPIAKINLNLPCNGTDFIGITLKQIEPLTDPKGLDLLYRNAINTEFNLHHRAHADLLKSGNEVTAVFTFRNAPEWVFGGQGRGFDLYLPGKCKLEITSIKVLPPQTLMPSISFANSGYLGTKGFLHLDTRKTVGIVTFDTKDVDGAAGVVFEITRPNLLFATQNTAERSRVLMTELQSRGTAGSIKLERNMFPSLGIYEGRAWAVDSQGNRLGVAGDHIVIAVDS